MPDPNNYRQFIQTLSQAPETQLARKGAEMCSQWDGQDPIRFLRDLRDLCVRYAWGSRFVMLTLNALLDACPPETDEEAEARRQELLRIHEAG